MRSVLPHRCLAWTIAVAVVIGFGSIAFAGATWAIRPTVAGVKSLSPSEFEIVYEWIVDITPTADSWVYVHFTDSEGVIKFKEEFEPDPAMTKWAKGKVKLARRTVKIPEGLSGPFEIRMGTFDKKNGVRDAIYGADDGKLRIRVGKIKVEGEKVVFEEPKPK
jgi:hypothetical protein